MGMGKVNSNNNGGGIYINKELKCREVLSMRD